MNGTIGRLCTPTPPTVANSVPCNSTGSQCENVEDGKPCWRYSGNALFNGKCIAPPSGFPGTPQCAMDPRSFNCRKYRTGTCEEEWIGTDCSCDLDSTEKWAKGKRKCAQMSTPCGGVIVQ